MVRISADLIEFADSFVNTLNERELDLRGAFSAAGATGQGVGMPPRAL
jgi:hypothetical protein